MLFTKEILARAILGMRAVGSVAILYRLQSTATRTWVEEEYQRTENELGEGEMVQVKRMSWRATVFH